MDADLKPVERKSKKKCTIYNVAAFAGVAPSTVSHVLNGTASISKETTDRVMEAVESLDYRPNANARSLRQKHSRIIGVILQDISSEYYAFCTSSILRCARNDNYVVLTSDANFSPEILEKSVMALIDRRVDGLIFIGGENDQSSIAMARNSGVPVVIGDRYLEGYPCVEFDNYNTTRNLVHALHDEGYRRFYYFGEMPEVQQNLTKRYEGFVQGMDECLVPAENWTAVLDERMHFNKWEASFEIFSDMLSHNCSWKEPTVVITSNDMIAQGLIGAALKEGISVPEDLAVIGFDNINMSAYVKPSLTTVEQDPTLLGKRCFKMLSQIIHKKYNLDNVMLDQKIIVRDSANIRTEILKKNHLLV